MALPWIITWFSHDVKSLPAVERLFDAFLSSHPALPLYASAVLILDAREKVLECECEFQAMHSLLSSLARDPALDIPHLDGLLDR